LVQNQEMSLSKITNTDLSNENFPWLKSREIKINDIEVLALRVNYAGELGWELHIPMNKMSDSLRFII
jgi:dimethylglycine dehydrogenase